MRLTDFEPRRVDELAPATLASYKKKAGAAATAADAAGDRKTADRRFSGIVKATKKQFDQDAKGVSEGLDDTVRFEVDSENAYNHVMDQFGSVIDWDGDTMVAPRKYWGAIQELALAAGGEASEEQGLAEGAPELLKKEMPLHRHAEKLLAHNGVSKDDPDYHHHLGNTIKHLRQFGNIDLINKQGVAEGSNKDVVKSIKVGNFRHDLVDTGMGWQVRIYNGDELYDTGLSKNSEQKGLAALDDAVAYTEKQTNTKRQGVAEAFGPLPKDNQQIRLGRHTVDIERVGLDKDYIGFAWHDSQGKEHYEEVPVGDLGSYDDLIDRIKQEISHQERQYTEQGVAEGKDEKIAQLKKDHDTAVHWSKNETSPQKREAARQKAEKIKGHLEKQYKQGVAEGSGESYIIVRTDSEGKKDVFAGNFDTYERAQKELDGLLAHPLHTKYKQKFEIKRKGGEQGVAEGQQIDEVFADQGSGSTDRDNAEYMKRRRAAKNTATRGSVTKKPQPYNDPNWIDKLSKEQLDALAGRNRNKDKKDVTEMDKSQTPPGRDTGPRSGPDRVAKTITSKQMQDQALDQLKQVLSQPEHMDILKRLKTKEDVAEADLDKFKKYTRPVVKTEPKIERTTNPAGRTTDHVEWKVTTPTGEIHRYKSKKQAQEHFDSFGHQGVSEGKADYNFDIEDLKRLERIRDLPTLKTQAMMLISKPSAKPMRPEKVEWFKNALERMTSPMAVIKLMYDLLLSGEGYAVVGSKSSMNPNSYRQRFNEQDVTEDALAGMKRLAGIATVPAQTTPGLRQYRHMPTAVQPR